MNINYYYPHGATTISARRNFQPSFSSSTTTTTTKRGKGRGVDSSIVKYCVVVLFGLLCTVFLLAHWLPPIDPNHNHQKRTPFLFGRDPYHSYTSKRNSQKSNHNNNNNIKNSHGGSRIAILMPYSPGKDKSNHNNNNHNNHNHNDNNNNGENNDNDHNNNNNNNSNNNHLMSYFLTFCTGAGGVSDLVDFLIFYTSDEDSMNQEWPDVFRKCPPNVKFISLESHHGLAQRLLRVVDHKYNKYNNNNNNNDNNNETNDTENNNNKPMLEYDDLLQVISSYIQVNPYGLVEFKPALGHIFQDYLDDGNYTHWGYSDMDILFGDLSRWMTPDEINNDSKDSSAAAASADIVTYTFGDQERLYLRGQFTIHKNKPNTLNQLWRGCSYLTDMDVRFYNIMHKIQEYRTESAEGCYSVAVLQAKNITIKYAVKAWTDISSRDTAYTHGVYLSKSLRTGRQVIYKVTDGENEGQDQQDTYTDRANYGKQASQLQPTWFEHDDAIYNNRSIPLQRQIGAMERINLDESLDPDANCMYWALREYQSKLCLRSGTVSSRETVYWRNGELFKQEYETTKLDSLGIVTGPFFHFQEWKRSYRYGQLATLYPNSVIQTTVLTPEGAIPMIGEHEPGVDDRTKPLTWHNSAPSPLGISDMRLWHGVEDDDRSQLPGHSYCLRSNIHSKTKRVKCTRAISWQNTDRVKILSGASAWKESVQVETDVTLVLTLELFEPNRLFLQNMIYHLTVSLRRWQGQPCVVVIYVGGASTEETAQIFEDKLNSESTFRDTTLIGIVYGESSSPQESSNNKVGVSRKALLNMAIDAAPTRWYLSGLELERGLSISGDAVFFSHQKSSSHSRLRGHVFWAPQYGLVKSNGKQDQVDDDIHTDLTLKELFDAMAKGRVKNLVDLESACPRGEEDGMKQMSSAERLWRLQTNKIIDPDKRDKSKDTPANQAVILEELDHTLLGLSVEENYKSMFGMDDTPILLTDNVGPFDGIRTNEVAREVEELMGLRCYNGLRMAQLAVLGYSFDILVGAFASSSESSRISALPPQLQTDNNNEGSKSRRCQGCSISNESLLSMIVRSEMSRVAKTAILWAESQGEKTQ